MSEERESSRWYILWDRYRNGTPNPRVRRNVYPNGKLRFESYPAKRYGNLKGSPELLSQFVEQLNHRHKSALERTRERYQFDHVFITQGILDKFREDLMSDIPDKRHAQYMYMALERDGLHWFISKLGLPDPLDWKRHEKQWGHALKSETKLITGLGKTDRLRIFDEIVNPNTIKKRIQILNKFLVYLHATMPETVPPIRLDPISKASMNKYKADYVLNEDYEPGLFIEDKDWKIIEEQIDPLIKTYVQLGYYFGLRKTETLGIKSDDLYEDCLKIQRQMIALDGSPKYGPLKSRKPRMVPYWFIQPDVVYDTIPNEDEKISPSWYGALFSREMERLNLPYKTHDLRRTFITKAFRAEHNARDIQLAVGHTDLNTTMRYAQDDRGLGSKKKFVPKKSG